MIPPWFPLALPVLILLWARFVAYRKALQRRKGLPYPPGPKGLPIIGNALDMPTSREWEKAAEWRSKYGELGYFLSTFGTSILIVM